MALVELGAITLSYIVVWVIVARRIAGAENRQEAGEFYRFVMGKIGKAYGVFVVYAFGLRLSHFLDLLTWTSNGVVRLWGAL